MINVASTASIVGTGVVVAIVIVFWYAVYWAYQSTKKKPDHPRFRIREIHVGGSIYWVLEEWRYDNWCRHTYKGHEFMDSWKQANDRMQELVLDLKRQETPKACYHYTKTGDICDSKGETY